jgi:tetrahydromethanopterin S-methyltransferase subunit F
MQLFTISRTGRQPLVPCFLLSISLLSTITAAVAPKADQRRANADLKTDQKKAAAQTDLVHEGSGGDEKHHGSVSADVEWNSGSGPDDEPGDVVEHVPDGSGHLADPTDVEIDGSGDTKLSAAEATSSVTSTTTTTTTSQRASTTSLPPFAVTIRQRVEIATASAPTTVASKATARATTTTGIYDEKKDLRRDPFLRPGILAAVIGGAVVGLLAAILLVMFIVYRMRKKDEGSYALDEPKQPPPHYAYAYQKAPTKEFYA